MATNPGANVTVIITGIVGSDGIVPVHNPDSRFQVWRLAEIFDGGPGANRYVPNPNDLVIDMNDGQHYRVIEVDVVTAVPRLAPLGDVVSEHVSELDRLLGVGPGADSSTYRVYVDKSVIPYVMTVDARLTVKGTAPAYAKIYRGGNLTPTGKVISAFYDSVGTLLGQSVPLEIVQMITTEGTNVAVKSIPVCYTKEELPDNEVVTVVLYSAEGHVCSKRALLVENTSFIRATSLGTKYITGVSLDCPFLSDTDPRLINLPMNIPLSGLMMMGVVHYSDGSTRKLPVDGTRMSVSGIKSYLATVVDQQVPIVLTYRLGLNEVVYGAGVGEFPHVSEKYHIKTAMANGAYNVKLFGYPVWVDSVFGYRMRWFLYSADRNIFYDVSGIVEYSSLGAPYNPTQYGVQQILHVAVNLRLVNGIYTNYRFTQTVPIILWREGTERTTNWTIQQSPGQDPQYGEDSFVRLKFINYNYYEINFGCDLTDKAEWLERFYHRMQPVTNPSRELRAPEPTHFRVKLAGGYAEFAINEWGINHFIGNGLDVNGTVFIEWIRRLPSTDLELGVSGIHIYDANW